MNLNEEAIAQKVDQLFSEYDAKTHGYLDIAIIGKVSSGKSSFLNAFFECPKNDPKFVVGAAAGVTKEIGFQLIGNHVRILDTPGLQDSDTSNIEKTKKLVGERIDIGILIIQGAADQQQMDNYNLLKKATKHVFVVLNKSDQDSRENLEVIKSQWKSVLNLESDTPLYNVCCRGYDPKDKIVDPVTGDEKEIPLNEYGVPKTINGMTEIRNAVFESCFNIGKIAFIAREIQQKQSAAIKIIAAACVASLGAIWLPGTIAFIGAAQASAISSLGYLYKGRLISKEEITKIMTTFSNASAMSIGAVAYALFVSFLPPTGVFDLAGIIIVIAYMASTLLIINYLFSKGLEIESSVKLTQEFNRIDKKLSTSIANADIREINQMNFWIELLSQITVNL